MKINWVLVNNGDYIFTDYGGYGSKLTFISDQMEMVWKKVNSRRFRLSTGNLSIINGRYWISKKGSDCFRIDAYGEHALIRDEWQDSYLGLSLKEKDALYFYRTKASSKKGYDYGVYPKYFKF